MGHDDHRHAHGWAVDSCYYKDDFIRLLVAAPRQSGNPLFRLAVRVATLLRLYPRIHLLRMPFKIVEYERLVQLVPPQGRVLDIGCGAGVQTLLLGKEAEAVGIDVDASAISFADWTARMTVGRLDARFVCKPLEDAGFSPNLFDVVYSFSTLEHIPNYKEVIGEAFRVLRPGGKIAISTDSLACIDLALREVHRRDHAVQCYFSPADLANLLKTAGFEQVKIFPLFTSPFAQRLFSDYIRTGFRPTHLAWIRQLRMLRLEEHAQTPDPSRPSVFLIGIGEKPSVV